MDKIQRQDILLQLRQKRSGNISLYCGVLVSIIVGLGVAVGLNVETDHWLRPIVLSVAGVTLVVILLADALRRNTSLIVRKLDARLATENDEPELLKSVRCFSDRANIPTPPVYLTDSSCLTAVSAGWSPNRSIIVLSSKTIKVLKQEELDSVIAHEICHIQCRDYLLRTIMFLSAGLLFLICWHVALTPVCSFEEIVSDITSRSKKYPKFSFKQLFYLPALVLLTPFLIICAWIIGTPIRRIIREQEYRADAGSIQMTDNPLALSGAISKLATISETPDDNSLRFLALFDMIEPSSHDKIHRKTFKFLYPSSTVRSDTIGDIGTLLY